MQKHESACFEKTMIDSIGSFWSGPALLFFMLIASLCSTPSLAAPAEETAEIPELFLLRDDPGLQSRARAAVPQTGRYPVRLNTGLNDAFLPLPVVRLSLPKGAQYEVIQDNRMVHPSGSITWVGSIKDYGNDYRVVITTGRQGQSFGRILTPHGTLQIESDDSGAWLIDPQEAGLLPGGLYDDAVPPPSAGKPSASDLPIHQRFSANLLKESTLQAQAAASTVDVMLLYTAGMAARYGSGLQARLDSLIALANQAYVDSQVSLTLRLIHAAQVDYSETTSNNAALDDLTDNSGAALASVNAWRDQYGADLVALLRPYNAAIHISCGMAWVNGFNGRNLSAEDAYAVVSDGSDAGGSNFFCDDYSLTHELGHSMGSQHDRANATYQGVFPYSYGYGFEGSFGTIMSYINPPVGKFSNPEITCLGSQACGVADYADNARSLNNTRATVASFKAAQIQPPPASSPKLVNLSTRGWVGSGDSVMIGGFILGEGTSPRKVIIRAIGPSLAQKGVSGTLDNPKITLTTVTGQLVASNDDWGSAANAAEIQALGRAPKHPNEAAILATLDPNVPYTPIVEGVGGATGNALVEIYEVQ